jgi:hypothetical protein
MSEVLSVFYMSSAVSDLCHGLDADNALDCKVRLIAVDVSAQ